MSAQKPPELLGGAVATPCEVAVAATDAVEFVIVGTGFASVAAEESAGQGARGAT